MRKDYSTLQMRDAFFEELYKYAKSNRDIIIISNDLGAISLDKFRKELPAQFINGGISEQNIISVAAGLALSGKRIFIYSIAPFITLRCLEQIKIDLCCMNLPVVILGVGASYSYALDGPTHHAIDDISVMRALAGLTIYSPSDSNIVANLVKKLVKSKGPVYVRLDRDKLPRCYNINENINKGFKVINNGTAICIITTGAILHTIVDIGIELKKFNINIKIIDVFRLKPININALIKEIADVKTIVSIEEHTLNGGLGSIISEVLHDRELNQKLVRLGIKDQLLYTYSLRKDNYLKNGIDKKKLIKFVKKMI